MMLMEMAKQAGVPDGVVNVIHGQKECKHKMIVHTMLYLQLLILFVMNHVSEQSHLLVAIELVNIYTREVLLMEREFSQIWSEN